jgi:hypothetical protein
VVTAAPGPNGPDFEIAQPILIVSCASAPVASIALANTAADKVFVKFMIALPLGAVAARRFFAPVPAKACPRLDRGWSPVHRQEHAPTSL